MRLVTPNVIHANVGKHRLVTSWDRFPYSPKTQYKNPIAGLRRNLRQLQLKKGMVTPMFVVDFSQKILHMSLEGRTWCGTVGGLMDPTEMAEGFIPDIRAEVFQDTMNKRLRYGEAGELTSPSISLATLEDEIDPLNGPMTFWTWTPKILEIVDRNRNEEKFVTLVVYINDVQIGSGTSRPEAVVKVLDYAFYYLAPKYAALGYKVKVRIIILGDYHHGDWGVYKANPSENYIFGLMSIRSQQAFGTLLLDPYLDDPEVLKWVTHIELLSGNHEWDSASAQLSGRNDLMPEYSAIKKAMDLLKKHGVIDHDISVNIHGRNRTLSSEKEGSPINWPMHVFEDHGFVVFNTHKLGMRGEPMKLFKQFAEWSSFTLASVTHVFKGHYHHPEFRQIVDTIFTVLGAYAGLSGYEAVMGMHAYAMPSISILTNAGFGQHWIPYDWLMESYKCRGALKDVDAAGELTPPSAKTSFQAWMQGKRSPYIEQLIWEKIHQHPPQLNPKPSCDFCWRI